MARLAGCGFEDAVELLHDVFAFVCLLLRLLPELFSHEAVVLESVDLVVLDLVGVFEFGEFDVVFFLEFFVFGLQPLVLLFKQHGLFLVIVVVVEVVGRLAVLVGRLVELEVLDHLGLHLLLVQRLWFIDDPELLVVAVLVAWQWPVVLPNIVLSEVGLVVVFLVVFVGWQVGVAFKCTCTWTRSASSRRAVPSCGRCSDLGFYSWPGRICSFWGCCPCRRWAWTWSTRLNSLFEL